MSNRVNDENVGLLKQLVTTVQKKNDKEKVDNSIKMKPAKVIGVDEDTYKVFVYFIDDIEQNAYTFYNKSGEVLSEGDNVRVYYTTNPAKGWIGARCGEPNIKEFENVENPTSALTEYEYLTDASVKFNGVTYTVEKDSTTGLISKISDSNGNAFEPTINKGITEVTLHNAVFWAVAMCRGISSVKLPQPIVELAFENSLANTGTGNYSVSSSGQMDYTTGITGDVYCYSAIYQSEVVVSGLSEVLNGDFTAVVWFKKNPYSEKSRLIWFTFNDLYYGVEFQGSACRALGAGFTIGNYADVEWHSCAIIKSGSRFATVFDGEETLTCNIGVTSNSGNIMLSWNSPEFFHGYIDSLRLYSKALTDEELKKALALK